MTAAPDEEPQRDELETLIVDHALPTIRTVVRRFAGSNSLVPHAELEEITATVTLQLVRKLRAGDSVEDEAIRDFEGYVATLTYRTIYDVLRERFPERTRLKNRLRYLLTHDDRFALWSTNDGMTCGLAAWQGRTDTMNGLFQLRGVPSAAARDQRRPAEAVEAIFACAGRPLPLESLVSIAAELWQIVDERIPHEEIELADPLPPHTSRFENTQLLEVVWKAIQRLPALQRAALLLNLRDPSGMNAIALFVVLGVARAGEIAAAIGATAAELASIWSSLPLDDLTIAARLGLTRQQVINLRRAARERLARHTRPERFGKRGG
ncbi:MAG TPA: hypothetical protein VEO54_14445 [Thermoanaerobaculia bacterium]|nr:hypothetical protein [Thermoanaerobaculia bacterium]